MIDGFIEQHSFRSKFRLQKSMWQTLWEVNLFIYILIGLPAYERNSVIKERKKTARANNASPARIKS